jgi:hypothetical protein
MVEHFKIRELGMKATSGSLSNNIPTTFPLTSSNAPPVPHYMQK